MTSRRLILATSYSEMLRTAAEFLPGYTEVLVIGPTRAAADEFARAACGSGVAGVHCLTLQQVAFDLAAQPIAARGLAPISRLAAEAVAARVVDRVRRQDRLVYFSPVADTPGFARALAATLAELRAEDVGFADLAGAGLPGVDLAQLGVLYAEELNERALADRPALNRMAAEIARRGSHRYVGLPIVLLDPALRTVGQRDLMAALSAKSPAVLGLTLAADEANARRLVEVLGVPPEIPTAGPSRVTLDRLRSLLFTTARASADAPPDETLEFFSAPGEGLETVEIARRIRRLAAEHGFAFDRVAILLRNPERYQPLVEEALRRAGIPGYFTRGSARPDPAGRAFLALMACAAEGCTASRFAEYLSLGQAPSTQADVGWVGPDPHELSDREADDGAQTARAEPLEKSGLPHFAWEKLLVDAAVVGGRERWERRLRGLEQELRLRLAQLDGDEAQAARVDRQLESLLELESFALPIIELLAALPERAAWGDWIKLLDALARTALRQPESVLSVLAELAPMSEVGPASLDEVAGVLSSRLRFLRKAPPARRYGCVFVGSIEEARARAFDIVFLPGLAEGLFPRRAFEDPLLLDVHRRGLGANLTLRADRVAQERMLLHTAAAASRLRLIVSYPRMDAVEARPRVPSFYAMEVVRAAEGSLPDLRDFERRAASSAPASLGWPAPDDTRDAIDNAEYDLAALGPFVTGRPGDARGKGRYLIDANAHLGRSLRTRWRRWHGAFSEADGIVQPDAATAAALATSRLNQRAYSPSTLQHYAVCPYRFLLHGIHRLHPREEPVALEQMDPLTRGSLFHAAQFELFRAIETGDHNGQILDLADRVLNRVAAEYAEKLAPAIPRVWQTEVEDVRMDLRGWIRKLPELLAEWRPVYYEFSFGLRAGADHDPRSTEEDAVVLDGIRLRGSMDIVEKHQQRNTLRITDHKTGKAPAEAPLYVGKGALMQPLLYALAAESIFGETVESGRLYYCTQRGSYQEYELPLSAVAREQVRRVLQTIDEAIATGFLPAMPQKESCENCDYRPVCGPYEEDRAQKKRPDPRLEGLVELRRTP